MSCVRFRQATSLPLPGTATGGTVEQLAEVVRGSADPPRCSVAVLGVVLWGILPELSWPGWR
jgi:hypothetical protein